MSLLTRSQLAALRAVDGTPNRVRAARDLAKVTQADVEEATGLVQPYISDVERGRFDGITLENARKFADYFGCSIEDLFPPSAGEAVAS